jgi:S-layer homology domain.
MLKKLLTIVIVTVLSLPSFSVMAGARESGQMFPDVGKEHWARSVIESAVSKGYVSGYPDGKFRPNQDVARSEFVKMLSVALKLQPEGPGQPWYQPYDNALRKAGILEDDDFHFLNYDAPITRLELIRLSVKALDAAHIGKEEIELVQLATETGLLRGIDGDLRLSSRTSRAEAAAFIERILALRNGETLPVDAAAHAKAKGLKADPWGRVIRTTNLPKNATEYPYILEGIPNAMYEMGYNKKFFPNGLGETSRQFHERLKSYKRENIDKWLPNAEQWLNMAVNVDYRTIDERWVKEMGNLGNYFARRDAIDSFYTRYAEKVRKEKIRIIGNVRLEPSIIVNDDLYRTFIRAKVEFKIVEAKNPKDVFFMSFQPKEGFEIGRWYRGYADIELGNMVTLPDTLTDMRVGHVYSTFFWNYDFNIKE